MQDEVLSHEARASFVADGVLGPFKVYDRAEAKEMGKEARIKAQDKTHAPYPTTEINYDRHVDLSVLSRHISAAPIVRRLQSLIGPDIFCWRSEFFPKYPGESGTEWHQVETYAYGSGVASLVPTARRAQTPTELTVWTAFTDVPRESGPLKFLPGSHKKWAFRETEKLKQFYGLSSNGGFFGYRYEELKVDPTWDPDAADQRVMEMEAGMAVIFTARCVHGSLPNTSTRHMRLGMATRYVPTDVKIYPDQTSFSEHGQLFDLSRWGAVLVAGRDDPKLNKVITANAHGEPFATLSRIDNLPTAKLCVGDQWAAE
jgi:non-haem Fe2+, alpha-ketoglutarate-dependent halogenase